MTSEELNSVLTLKAKLELERAKLEDLKFCAASAVPSKLSDVPRAKTQKSPTENFAVKIVEVETLIAKLETELDEARESLVLKLQTQLQNSPPLWTSVLVRRFAACFTSAEIAQQLNYTKQHIQLIQRQATSFVTNGAWRPKSPKRQSA